MQYSYKKMYYSLDVLIKKNNISLEARSSKWLDDIFQDVTEPHCKKIPLNIVHPTKTQMCPVSTKG